MKAPIKVGDVFNVTHGTGKQAQHNTFRRETDDPTHPQESRRICVTHLTCSHDAKLKPYTFGTEPEWFRQRGLEAA